MSSCKQKNASKMKKSAFFYYKDIKYLGSNHETFVSCCIHHANR